MAARLRYARFPFRRTIDAFDPTATPAVPASLLTTLASCAWIDRRRAARAARRLGCGKTHLAVALAIKVVEAGWRGYTTADDMTRTLVRAQIEGTWTTKLKTYTAPTVLVIDDVGLLPMADRARSSPSADV